VQHVPVFYAKICSLLTRRRSIQPVQRVYWPANVIDWLGKWRPTCVMRHARGQKLQSFRLKWPFYMDLYSMPWRRAPRRINHISPRCLKTYRNLYVMYALAQIQKFSCRCPCNFQNSLIRDVSFCRRKKF
jgi:hypothetical protein